MAGSSASFQSKQIPKPIDVEVCLRVAGHAVFDALDQFHHLILPAGVGGGLDWSQPILPVLGQYCSR